MLDAFAYKHGGIFTNQRLADVCELKWKGKTLICIKPTTYVNLSGKAFKYWIDKEKMSPADTLTVVDDIALPLEKIRLRTSGSAGGHNGLKDIQFTLGNENYPRLRFGIGNNYPKGMQAEFVLSKWFPEEIPVVQEKINFCIEVIETIVTAGFERAISLTNSKNFTGAGAKK